jgi:hypothetical protein
LNASRNQPGVAFWATVVVVVALIYPISFGPACWLMDRTRSGSRIVATLYRPMMALIAYGPLSISDAATEYANLFAHDRWAVEPVDLGWVKWNRNFGDFVEKK